PAGRWGRTHAVVRVPGSAGTLGPHCALVGSDRLGPCPPCLCSSSPSSSWWASARSPSPPWRSPACSIAERSAAPMHITLDTSLPPALYPLAWLIGSWEGAGALTAAEPGAPDARIEQQLVCTAREDGTMEWRSTIHRVDAP